MRKNNKTSKQTPGIVEQRESKQSNEIAVTGATKKCPYCGEDLPVKIAFCLYCMKSLVGDTAPQPETKQQNNGVNPFQKRSTKVLIGAAALLTVVAIVAATSFITASILSRHTGTPHQPAISATTMPHDEVAVSTFIPEPTPLPTLPYNPEPTPTPLQNTEPMQIQQTDANITVPSTVTPRFPAQAGGPVDPPISAQRATELARDHLISIGVTSAAFDYIYMDRESNTWVWSVEFDGRGRSYEFYVDVNTGEFLKFPNGTNSVNVDQSSASSSSGTSSSQRGSRPSNPAISLERAIEIGYEELARRGHTGTFRSDSGIDWEHGQWVWELLFRVEGGRLPLVEMYINVDTGAVIKFEWDD